MWLVLIVIFGCETKDPYEDTASETDHYAYDPGGGNGDYGDYGDLDGDGDVDGSGVEGGEDVGGEDDVGDSASCDFGAVCIETTAADPTAWCENEGGQPDVETCPGGFDGKCDIPANPDNVGPFADAAIVYYYGLDGEVACTDVGGTYTAIEDGGEAEDTGAISSKGPLH